MVTQRPVAKAAAAPPHGTPIKQGSSGSGEDAIGTLQRFRRRDVTAQVVPRGQTVVTLLCNVTASSSPR